MTDLTKTERAALKNIIVSKISALKMTLKKGFKTVYSDKWPNEEQQINLLVQELKTSLNQEDNKRIQAAIDDWKSYLMIDESGISNKISEVNLRAFLNTSDGRYYGGVYSDFKRLLEKLDNNTTLPNQTQERNVQQPISKPPEPPTLERNNQIEQTSMLTIEHPLTGATLQVANQDFTNSMMWGEAKKACANLGSGWRLPTIEELEAMYLQLQKEGRGSFREREYWSSSSANESYAYALDFYRSGRKFENYKSGPDFAIYVRAVRSL